MFEPHEDDRENEGRADADLDETPPAGMCPWCKEHFEEEHSAPFNCPNCATEITEWDWCVAMAAAYTETRPEILLQSARSWVESMEVEAVERGDDGDLDPASVVYHFVAPRTIALYCLERAWEEF